MQYFTSIFYLDTQYSNTFEVKWKHTQEREGGREKTHLWKSEHSNFYFIFLISVSAVISPSRKQKPGMTFLFFKAYYKTKLDANSLGASADAAIVTTDASSIK